MRHESAHYWLTVPADAEDELLMTLYRAGAEQLATDDQYLNYCLHEPTRYWIDIRVHRPPKLALELRIALTNDPWSIRGPLERALSPLPEGMAGHPVLDANGEQVTVAGTERWWYEIEADYGRHREEFVAAVGDITAAVSVDQVYFTIHHERRRRNLEREKQEQREDEIEFLKQLWEQEPAPPDADVD